MFWFAWSFYWAVKVVMIGKWRHYIFLSVFASLCVGTKDGHVGYIAGLAAAVCIGLVARAFAEKKSFFQALRTLINPKVFLAVLIFLFCFGMINNIITNPEGFKERMDYWFTGRGISKYTKYPNTLVGQSANS